MSAAEVEKALGTLEELARRGDRPSHYVARHLLLSIGAVLRARAPEEEVSRIMERARVAGRATEPGWGEAVRTELALACGEFAQCLEPRYLSLPGYDIDYTRAARSRLEDRLLAARALGFDLAPRDQGLLELADQVLAQFLAGKPAGSPVDPPQGPKPGPGTAKGSFRKNRRK